jgi:hypothetical protein
MWVKRGSLGSAQNIFAANGTTDTTYLDIRFTSSDTIQVGVYNDLVLVTSQVFRDPSAWYHIVWLFDTTQASASNRCRLFVNGSEITAFSTDSRSTYFAQNTNYGINNNTAHNICRNPSDNAKFFDGYLTEVNFIDGQALTPSSFGETSTTTGVWIPKKYTGTYGTNGFYLKFTDTTSTSTLGTDFSGNSNTWTVNNISLTAGSTYDSMTDVPTLTDITTANYCVLSPVDTYDNPPTEGNLRRTGVGHTGSPWSTCRATLGVSSGKWYFEGTLTGSTGSVGNNMIGVMTTTTSTLSDAYGGSTTRSYQANGNLQGDNSTGTVSSATSGDVIMIAFDVDAGKLWVGKNGTWMNSGVPASGTGNVFTTLPTSPIVPQVSMYGNTGDNYGWFTNFGQRPFAYTPPTGFLQLNTFNLPTPTIGATASTTANKYFDAKLYTGNGGTQSITGFNFSPDFIWAKSRSNAVNHNIYDSIRGVNKLLSSSLTDAEYTGGTGLTSFNSDGYTTGSDSWLNASGQTYVAWGWDANGTGVTNTAGSITSTVSANTTAGFSIVTYTGSGSAATVGHGLGVAPSMIIVKDRDNGTYDWNVYHASLSSPTTLKLYLNLSDAENNGGTNSGTWNSTAPTSTVFSLGTFLNVNKSGDKFVAYCFAPVAGYSAFGSYTGNGSTDGTFIFTGFRPRYLMIKSTSVESWELFDTSRSPYNQAVELLEANASGSENTSSTSAIDILSNGFKQRNTRAATNGSGTTYIYMAFAENPFKYSNAR